MRQNPRALRLAIPFLAATILLTNSAALASDQDGECVVVGPDAIEICDQFLAFWENNGGEATFGNPLTQQFNELDSETREPRPVQYFENVRMELRAELADSPWEVQLGRLGDELLLAEGVDWQETPGSEPGEGLFFDATGHAVAPEFEAFWSVHGIDLGDNAAPLGESIALFGYPLTSAQEIERDGETFLTQWFERTRLELNGSGEVEIAPVGMLSNDDAGGLSVRMQREIGAVLSVVSAEIDTTGLAVWVGREGYGEWTWSEGYADPDAGEQYTRDTHHRIGSVTKTFIATLVLQLADEGMIDLEDTVDQWFPELDRAEDITVRMLANMTSGIANYSDSPVMQLDASQNTDRVWTPEELLEYAFEANRTGEPGEGWSYSNTNYVMLGLIIEDVTGNGVREELRDRILDPLGLENTSFPDDSDAGLPDPHARGFSVMGLPLEQIEVTDWNPSWTQAAGQMISTGGDMLIWLDELRESVLLSEEMQAERVDLVEIVPGNTDITYGFGILHEIGWYGHDGLIAGYASLVMTNPETGFSIVVFNNATIPSDDGALAHAMTYGGVRSLLDREYRD